MEELLAEGVNNGLAYHTDLDLSYISSFLLNYKCEYKCTLYIMIDFLSSEDENRIKFQNQLSGQKLFLIELFIRYNIIMGKLEL